MPDSSPEQTRCAWVNLANPLYVEYHDQEWGVPVHDDVRHFEMLILEGAQAGLSWETVLKKRDGYRKAFHGFIPQLVAAMTDEELTQQLSNPDIIRNRLKVFGTRQNARVFLDIQKEFGSFDAYVWQYVGGKPLRTLRSKLQDIPARTAESDALSKDLKKRGMTFVGTTIIYAYMQAIGMVNDHTEDCFCCRQ
jgi:DNA-3-methyladenine glycosylase I